MICAFHITLQAIGPLVFGAVLFNLPFTFAADFEIRAVDQQVQGFSPTPHRNIGDQGGLPPIDGAETGYRPVESE